MLYLFTITLLIISVIRWLLGKRRVGNYGDKSVFITGCDTGFGNLLAKRLDRLGMHVFAGCLTENGASKLKSESSPNLKTVILDVTDETSISLAVDSVKQALPPGKGLWALVNNAGLIGNVTHIGMLTQEDYEHVLAVNLYGTINTTKAFLSLIRRTPGRIVNMASMSGLVGVAFAPYAVSKFGVEGYSDCLRHELYKLGISVHIIEPGFYATTLVDKKKIQEVGTARFLALDKESQEYYGQEYLDKVRQRIGSGVDSMMSTKLEEVVDAYEHAITSKLPKARYLVGTRFLIFAMRMMRILPEWTYIRIVTRGRPVPKGRYLANDMRREDRASGQRAESPLMNV